MMTVRSEKELKDLLEQGWHLYYHSTQRRWYAFKDERLQGKKSRTMRIVDARLDKICEELKEAERKRGVPVGEIQEARWSGESIEGITEETGLSRTAVYNAFDKDPQETVLPRCSRESEGESEGESEEAEIEIQEPGVGERGPEYGPWETFWAWLGVGAAAAVVGYIYYRITEPVITGTLKAGKTF